MAILPEDIPTGKVTGQFYFVNEDTIEDPDLYPQLTVVTGFVRFKASIKVLRMSARKAVVIPLTFDAKFNSEGKLVPADHLESPEGIYLPATDSTEFDTTDWTWTATFELKDADTGHTIQIDPITFQVPDGSELDLSTVVPAPDSPGVITTRGPQGDKGDKGDKGDIGPSPTDPLVAGYLTDPVSESRSALSTAIVEHIASDPTVANAAAAAVDANPTIAELEARTKPISPAEDDVFRVRDAHGFVALEVSADGSTGFAGTKHRASDVPYRVVDAHGQVAFEIDDQGRTHIHDLAGGGGGSSQRVSDLHVFVAAGQSNMSGRGDPLAPELDTPNPRIMQYGASRRTLETATVPLDMHDTPIGLSPATVFAREYLRDMPSNIGVLLIPAAHGGTGFTWDATTEGLTWSKGKATNPDNALYEKSVAQSLEGIQAAENAGYTVHVRGVLWHQGEANGGWQTAGYSAALDSLIADYRADLGISDLPFVVGQQMPEGMESNPSKYTVDKSHAETPARVIRTGFATAPTDTQRFNDFAHFARDGVVELGASMIRAYQQAVMNVPTGRPLRPNHLTATRFGDLVRAEWVAPLCHVTSYRLEYRIDDGAWTEVTREWPMYPYETFTVPSGQVWVRVTTIEGEYEVAPTLPVPAIGA